MPPILSGILAIYGLVVGVIICSNLAEKSAIHTNFLYLAAGLSVGLSCLSAGFCIGIVGDAGVRATGQQPRMFVGMMMMLIFAEVLGEYLKKWILDKKILTRDDRDLWTDRGVAACHQRAEGCNAVFVLRAGAG
jgi:F0F1-type ATP synthase membrane subunit c/vacuolar-type H+-ATPase subunit K